MRSIIILLCILLVTRLEAEGSSACSTGGRISFTGQAETDFQDCQYFDDPGNFIIDHFNQEIWTEITDVSILAAIGLRSGWDLRSIYFHYLPQDDVLQVGIRCYGICGDADGDGDAGSSSYALQVNGGIDFPRLGQSEAIALLIDPINNGSTQFIPTILIGKPSLLMDASTFDFGIYNFTNGSIDSVGKRSFISAGQKIMGPILTDYRDPMDRQDAVEFSIVGFSNLPGIRPINGRISFSFSLFAGSAQDGDIWADYLPELVPSTGNEPSGTIVINQYKMRGIQVNFACPNSSLIDSCGVCGGNNRNRDRCGVCFGNNEAMNRCGVCFGAANQTCNGVIDSFRMIDLSQFGINATGPYNIESAGDVNNDGHEDIVLGLPWDADMRGRLHLFLLGENMSILQHVIIDSRSRGFNSTLMSGDLFGTSLTSLKTQTVNGGACFAVGAPGTNNTVGAVHVMCLDKSANITFYSLINTYNQDKINRGYFGYSLSVTHLQETIVLIASATGPYLLSNMQVSDAVEGSVYLIVLGYDNRILGVKEVFIAELYQSGQITGLNVTSDELARTTFGVQAIPIGDLNDNGVSEIVVTVYIWKNRPGLWESLTLLPERTLVILVYLNLDGSASQVLYIPEPLGLTTGNSTSLWGASIGAVGDVNGDERPDIAIGAPRCQTIHGPTGCIYIVSVGENQSESDTFKFIRATTNALTDILLPESRFAGSLVSINSTQGALLLATFDRTNYGSETVLSYTPPAFMVLHVNGQDNDGPTDYTPSSPPGAVFVPVPNTPQTSTPTVFGNDAPPIFITYPNDSLPNFMITPVATSNTPVGAGINFDRIAEVDDEGREVLVFDLGRGRWSYTDLSGSYHRSYTTELAEVPLEIVFAHLLEAKQVQINGGQESFRIDANTFKFSFKLGKWPFSSLTNKLVVTTSLVFLDNSPVLTSNLLQDGQSVTGEHVARYQLLTETSEVRTSIALFCVADGTIQPVEFEYITNSTQIKYTLPNYRNNVDYDPDITVIDNSLGQDTGPSVDGIIQLLYILIVAGVLIIGFAIIFPIAFKKYKKRKQHEKKWKEAAQENTSTQTEWTKSSNTTTPQSIDIPLQQSVQV
eukprot:TRINITY_DN3266_c0_g1_i1.p1 TRINITY_DN3266_c0_g1~~TRINITY_DN3266_c0_g1_i1.p1  ORF type:complete len:1098 (+),score=212.70 TRINITY_DN3266_c0_g1_i1:45-3338(+)